MDQPYRIGAIEVRPVERELRVDGVAVPLGARAFDVLLVLLRYRDRVVTKNELLDEVWPDTVVEENNLQAQVSQLRKIMGPKAIATIPGRGYRFAMAVASEAPPPGTAVETPRVPLGHSSLVGREAELAAVVQLLQWHRLVTIAGAGGIGKTRLAQAVFHSQASEHAHGACWVDLGAITTAEKLAPAIANAANLHLGEGAAEAFLTRAAKSREMLIVLDNCEHMVRHLAPLVAGLHQGAPGVRILATSQEVLQVPGEHVYRLDALAVPAAGTPLEAARTFGAIALLEQAANAADGRFALDPATLDAAIELCRRLDGMPLAIEMAAARLPMLGCEALLTRLDERMRLLRSAHRGVPARQQTLQAMLDWSHGLLSADEQAVFRRLAVFRGSFRLEVAQWVSGWGALDEWASLDALMALVDKSLVQVEPGEPPRYRLLETARLYAFERLAEHREKDAALERHGEAMAVLAETGIGKAYWEQRENPSAAEWYPDYEDVHAAFDHAAERGDTGVMALTGRFLAILDFERNVYSAVRRRKVAAYARLSQADPLNRAWLLSIVCLFRLIWLPETPRVKLSEKRVAAWRAIGDRRHIYLSLSGLASDYAVEGKHEASIAALVEAQSLEDPRWTPQFRWFLAWGGKDASLYRGSPAEIERWSQRMLQLAREARWPARVAESHIACAQAALIGGDVAESIRLSAASAASLRELNQPINLLEALTTLCASHVAASDFPAARAAARQALDLPWQLENALPYFDQVARLAALGGHCEAAATLLGFADHGYEVAQDVRHTVSAAAEAQAVSLASEALGFDRHERARKAGASIPEEMAHGLAREVLA